MSDDDDQRRAYKVAGVAAGHTLFVLVGHWVPWQLSAVVLAALVVFMFAVAMSS